jgi:gamma-glutamyl phosphate reductase
MLEAKAADLAAARGEASELLSRLSLATERIKVIVNNLRQAPLRACILAFAML